MALHTTQSNGGTAQAWAYNDFLQLLTGVMTDQQVTLAFTSAVAGTPTLTLKASNVADPLIAFKSDGTTESLRMDRTGNLKVIGNITDYSSHNYPVIVAAGGTPGRQIFVGTTTPTGANEGDIWVKG